MDIHQCPRCELRFVHTSELRHHFQVDHGADPDTFERFRYRSSPSSGGPTTILLVANQTLGRDEVIDELRRRATEAGARVLVLAPATFHRGADDEATARSLARWRVEAAVERLRGAGLEVEGRVGDADPFGAVCEVLADEQVDEIVVSTLPAASSRWLEVDLPGQLRRYTRPAVTVLTSVPLEATVATDVTS